jgi:hypothetical protein
MMIWIGARTARKSLPPTGQHTDAVEDACKALVSGAVHVMPAAVTKSCLGVEEGAWEQFRTHWDNLSMDGYAADQGICRLRRYGQFSFTPALEEIRLVPQTTFVQPQDSNPLYIGVERTFEPLTGSFVADRVFQAVLRLIGQVAKALDNQMVWKSHVHPFRVVATAEADGLPTPEGQHRDGVTLVSSLLIGRENAAGGESSVFDPDGRQLLTTTLNEPGTLLLCDDRRTLHSVSAVRPLDQSRPAYRDVLVITFIGSNS